MKTLDNYEVPEKVEEEIKYRIKRLPREEIDQLYYDLGFIVTNAEDDGAKADGNKALTDKQLDSIKQGDDFMIKNLVEDSNKETLDALAGKLSLDDEF